MRGLVNLQVLRLSGIDLYEATTSSEDNLGKHISHLSNLRDLDLSGCHLSGKDFPINECQNLSHLSSLKMNDNNELNSPFSVQLANLTSLSILELADCKIGGLVPYLPQLRELDVGGNRNLHLDVTRIFIHQ